MKYKTTIDYLQRNKSDSSSTLRKRLDRSYSGMIGELFCIFKINFQTYCNFLSIFIALICWDQKIISNLNINV